MRKSLIIAFIVFCVSVASSQIGDTARCRKIVNLDRLIYLIDTDSLDLDYPHVAGFIRNLVNVKDTSNKNLIRILLLSNSFVLAGLMLRKGWSQ